MQIDLNSDLGEGFGPYKLGDDEALLKIVTSANIACGYHAGDAVIMDKSVRAALANKADIGAHVGFPDRLGFGRHPIHMELAELEKHVIYQLGALEGIARAAGHKMTHMNFHGALGNMAFVDRPLAEMLVDAVASFNHDLILLCLANTEFSKAAEKKGFKTANVFLADRAYDDDGILVKRGLPGAVIEDPEAVKQRVKQFLDDGAILSINGKRLTTPIHTILVHGDTPGSVTLANTIRSLIQDEGHALTPLSQMDL
ncbi:LamB/YcsF family protein [Cohaesibacter intestini]|uniref:LamB/YcsF family protein n=1 Tax=Cohaesibacter intestini TaxID=2211145 RepID=UPI000DE8CC7D|nr:5-oxoprolinase subunit PxpA [Cohaesibacter intestini]